MMLRLLLPVAALAAGLPSCKVVAAPFRVAGAVAEGTAYLGKSAYDASKKPFEKSEEEKREEAKKKAADAEAKAQEEKAKRAAEVQRHGDATRQQATPATDDSLPPLPPELNEPLPQDAPLPYEGE